MEKSYIEIVELIVLCLIAILVLVGNVLVILAFWLGPRSIRTHTNYFVVNLAVSDLMVGLVSLPFWIINRADSSLISPNVYQFFIALDILCGTCSILSLAAISLERMYAVKFPTKHFNLSTMPVMCVIVASWSYSIILTTIKFITNVRTFTALIFALAFCLPLLVIIGSYCVIFYTAVRMFKASNQTGKIARELRVAKTISVIISLFIFCWMPFFVINMVYIFCNGACSHLPIWVIFLTKMIHYTNSMMNFFVYAVRSPDFRRSFKAILFKCNTDSLRDKIRTFSESVSITVSRSRTNSERHSFYNSEKPDEKYSANSSNNHLQKHRPLPRKNSKLSNLSNNTEVSMMEDDISNSSYRLGGSYLGDIVEFAVESDTLLKGDIPIEGDSHVDNDDFINDQQTRSFYNKLEI